MRHRCAERRTLSHLVEEQLLYKMAWGTALNSSMPQNAPRLPPSEPCLEKSYVSTPFIVFRLAVCLVTLRVRRRRENARARARILERERVRVPKEARKEAKNGRMN